jgi:hypothetical protein
MGKVALKASMSSLSITMKRCGIAALAIVCVSPDANWVNLVDSFVRVAASPQRPVARPPVGKIKGFSVGAEMRCH